MTTNHRKLCLLLILAATVIRTRTETQWASHNNAEEEEEKEINTVFVNISSKITPPSQNDEGINISPTEDSVTTDRGGSLEIDTDISDREQEANKHKNDASPVNAVDRNLENEDIASRIDNKPELDFTTPSTEEESLEPSVTEESTEHLIPQYSATESSILSKNETRQTDIGTSTDISVRNLTVSPEDCANEGQNCKNVSFLSTEETPSRFKDKIPLWISSAITVPSVSVWNVVKPLKPLERIDGDVSNTLTSTKVSSEIRSTIPSFLDSSTAQTSENLIVVEGSAANKDDYAQQNYLNKSEKSKQIKQDETHVNSSEERPLRDFAKTIETTPMTEIEKKSTPLRDDPLATTLLPKLLETSLTPLSIQSGADVWNSATNSSTTTSLYDKNAGISTPHASKLPHEVYSPNSDLFTTDTWYNAKSSFSESDDKITKDYTPLHTHVTPLLFPSFRETTKIATESEVLPSATFPFSPASDVSSSVTTSRSLVSATPSKKPTDDHTTSTTEHIPPPRLTNPGCSSLPICIELTLLETSWDDFCSHIPDLQKFLSTSASHYMRPIHAHQVVFDADKCTQVVPVVRESPDVSVGFYITDDSGEYEERLTEICGVILGKWAPTSFRNTIIEVRFYNAQLQSTSIPVIPELNSGFVAAVAISAVAGVALCLLCILLVVMKQKLLHSRNSETTTPAADAYSLDSLSINASFRRRRTRRSARSYLNHAFNDQEIPSHPLDEKTLTNIVKNRDLLEAEFKKIPMNMPKLDQIPEGAHVKNRFSNILPKPETRVVLADPSGDPLKCYINANYIKGYEGKAAFYIACQAPLPDGIEDFWRMVWEQQCRVIVMLTMFEENGTARCAAYFPQSTLVAHPPYGDFQVSLQKKEVYEFYTISTLRILDMEKNLFRDVAHLWYTSWPDVGVPKDPSSLIAFVQQCRPYINCNSGPTIVHCSTGTGRTGVFLSLDICMREYDESKSIDILQCVSQLRRDRGGAVQNRDQYTLIHEAMLEYISQAENQSQRPSIRSSSS